MRRMWLMRSVDVRVVLGFVVHCRPILMRKRREGRREIWRRSGVLEALWGSVMAGRDGMGVVKVLSTGSSGVLVWTLKGKKLLAMQCLPTTLCAFYFFLTDLELVCPNSSFDLKGRR